MWSYGCLLVDGQADPLSRFYLVVLQDYMGIVVVGCFLLFSHVYFLCIVFASFWSARLIYIYMEKVIMWLYIYIYRKGDYVRWSQKFC